MVSSALVPIVAQGRIQTFVKGGSELACMGIFFLACHTHFWDNSSIINLETYKHACSIILSM